MNIKKKKKKKEKRSNNETHYLKHRHLGKAGKEKKNDWELQQINTPPRAALKAIYYM